MSLKVTQGDKGFTLTFNIKDAAGDAVDLIAVTEARFRLIQVDTLRNILDKLATVQLPPSAGVVKYTVENGDFSTRGNFRGAVVLKEGTTKVVTTTDFFVSVEPSFGKN